MPSFSSWLTRAKPANHPIQQLRHSSKAATAAAAATTAARTATAAITIQKLLPQQNQQPNNSCSNSSCSSSFTTAITAAKYLYTFTTDLTDLHSSCNHLFYVDLSFFVSSSAVNHQPLILPELVACLGKCFKETVALLCTFIEEAVTEDYNNGIQKSVYKFLF